MVDDTESASVKIYAKRDGKFSKTGVFTDIGVRPHFCTYNEKNKTFYILSSMTGEMYLIRRMEGSHKLYLTEVKRLDRLNGIYVRSFTIENDEIIFVSGITPEESGYEPAVVVCDLDSFEIKEEYPVSSAIAGMVQITPIDGKYYITVSTDAYGNAEASRMIAADSLSELSPDNYNEKDYPDLYREFFADEGTPYYISCIPDDLGEPEYFLCSHQNSGHGIYRFKTDAENIITDVEEIY